MKLSDLYKVLKGIKELKSFVNIIGRPPPRVYNSVIIKI
jgi:hypothetical protein